MSTLIELPEIDSQALSLVDQAKLPINDDASYAMAGLVGKTIKELLKSISDNYDPAIESAHKTHKAILDAKKEHSKPLEEAQTVLKRAMAVYTEKLERQRTEEARIAQERAREEQALLDALGVDEKAVVADAPLELPKTAGISYRTVWEYEITDLSLIPREYLIVDEKKIGGVVRAMKEMANIPGVKVTSRKATVI